MCALSENSETNIPDFVNREWLHLWTFVMIGQIPGGRIFNKESNYIKWMHCFSSLFLLHLWLQIPHQHLNGSPIQILSVAQGTSVISDLTNTMRTSGMVIRRNPEEAVFLYFLQYDSQTLLWRAYTPTSVCTEVCPNWSRNVLSPPPLPPLPPPTPQLKGATPIRNK